MFFTMFLVIDYVINLQMIMRIFPSVILISHFNISCDSKFIFYVKNMICFLMKIQINIKSSFRIQYWCLQKRRSFYLYFCLFLVICAVALAFVWLFMLLLFFISVIKIVKLMFFAIKHRDSLRRRKQDGSRVNTFCYPDLCRLFVWLYFWNGYKWTAVTCIWARSTGILCRPEKCQSVVAQ